MGRVKSAPLSGDRYGPAERLIRLGLILAEARGGLTLDQMAVELGVGRRTAERLRDALDRVIAGGLASKVTDEGQKRWTLPSAKFTAFTAPAPEELAELKLAARRLRELGSLPESNRLEKLALKLEAALPRATMRRFEPDIEMLMESRGVLFRPGPKTEVDELVMATLQDAILGNHQVRLSYRRRDGGGVSRPRLHPYGILAGSRAYLVGWNAHPEVREHRLYVLGNIEAVEVLDRTFEREPGFDLRHFAARSFGTFWDGESFEVEWMFKPEVADDARRFRFHPSQVVTDEPDGSVRVTFLASGLTEMAWHLFTWGEGVEIVRPEELKERYRECLKAGVKTR